MTTKEFDDLNEDDAFAAIMAMGQEEVDDLLRQYGYDPKVVAENIERRIREIFGEKK